VRSWYSSSRAGVTSADFHAANRVSGQLSWNGGDGFAARHGGVGVEVGLAQDG